MRLGAGRNRTLPLAKLAGFFRAEPNPLACTVPGQGNSILTQQGVDTATPSCDSRPALCRRTNCSGSAPGLEQRFQGRRTNFPLEASTEPTLIEDASLYQPGSGTGIPGRTGTQLFTDGCPGIYGLSLNPLEVVLAIIEMTGSRRFDGLAVKNESPPSGLCADEEIPAPTPAGPGQDELKECPRVGGHIRRRQPAWRLPPMEPG